MIFRQDDQFGDETRNRLQLITYLLLGEYAVSAVLVCLSRSLNFIRLCPVSHFIWRLAMIRVVPAFEIVYLKLLN